MMCGCRAFLGTPSCRCNSCRPLSAPAVEKTPQTPFPQPTGEIGEFWRDSCPPRHGLARWSSRETKDMAAVHDHRKIPVLAGLVTILMLITGQTSTRGECSSDTPVAGGREPVYAPMCCFSYQATVPAPETSNGSDRRLYTVTATFVVEMPVSEEVETGQNRCPQPGVRFRGSRGCPEMIGCRLDRSQSGRCPERRDGRIAKTRSIG